MPVVAVAGLAVAVVVAHEGMGQLVALYFPLRRSCGSVEAVAAQCARTLCWPLLWRKCVADDVGVFDRRASVWRRFGGVVSGVILSPTFTRPLRTRPVQVLAPWLK